MERTDFENQQPQKKNRKPVAAEDARFRSLVDEIRESSVPLREVKDLDRLIDRVKDARIVMLGESTHGTKEFYEWRRLISAWLITHHGFDFIAVEGDWPSCWEIDRYIRGEKDGNAEKTLHSFQRWPTWMWANREVARLAEWLRSHNSTHDVKAGFYGLDVYSFFESMNAILAGIRGVDPDTAKSVAEAYSCFDRFDHDEKAYARSLIRMPAGCKEQAQSVVEKLADGISARLSGAKVGKHFDLEQNARVVKNAEAYYRTMMLGGEDSWNVRDRHMIETLDELLQARGPKSRAIVWAHNTHVGDYRATDMFSQGLVNIGGLAREKWGTANVALVGFGTNEGEVVASRAWGGETQRMSVPAGETGSYEAAFHVASEEGKYSASYVIFGDRRETAFADVRGHRAIGVVYNPEYERHGNYVPTILSQRYDAFVFVDRTKGVEPILASDDFDRREIPETWPKGE